MNKDYPPLVLSPPLQLPRRPAKPSFGGLPEEKVQARKAIADALQQQLQFVSRRLRQMTEEERRAVLLKLEHDGRIRLPATDLKVIAENESFTLAVPREKVVETGELAAFSNKLEEFAEGELNRAGQPRHASLAMITAIAEGVPTDRLSEQLYENYEKHVRAIWLTFEVELLSLLTGRNKQRSDLRRIRLELQDALSGRGTIFEHEESGRVCRVVVGCDGSTFRKLVEDREWQVKLSWFESRPQFETFHTILSEFGIGSLGELKSPDSRAPVVCIVDSGITHGNPFLEPVTREDLLESFLNEEGSDEFGPEDQVSPDGHGSGVGSLAAYYSLALAGEGTNIGRLWITGGRVLDENCETGNRLFSKMLREVVEFYVPHGIRIFNLSVNDKEKRWHRDTRRTVPRNSWIARSIDNLSREFDVVFVVSTGNLSQDEIDTFLANGDWYPDYFRSDETTLLDPAQAALALTVGSIAASTLAIGAVAGLSSLADANHPSPFTRRGPGINNEIKPEFVEHGGNYLLDESNSTIANPGTSIIMASNHLTPAITWSVGTSFATAKVTHKLGITLADLNSLGVEPSAPLLKALLVNSASHDYLQTQFVPLQVHLDGLLPKLSHNVVGYGVPSELRATYCDQFSALMFYEGVLEKDQISYFSIPVPQSLAFGRQGTKRLSITLVYDSEVQNWGLEDYLGLKVKWKIFRGDIPPEDIIISHSSDDDIDDLRELPNAKIGKSVRSRGSVQHDVYEWERHQVEHSENHYTLVVIPQSRWSRNVSPARFGIVVRIEDTTGTAPIYTDIQSILTSVEVQVNV